MTGDLRCAWCGRVIGTTDAGPEGSDGICMDCLREYFPATAAKVEEKIKERNAAKGE